MNHNVNTRHEGYLICNPGERSAQPKGVATHSLRTAALRDVSMGKN